VKNLRVILPGLALAALTLGGCFITSGQIFVHYALPNPFTIAGADGFERVSVDLSTVKDYQDNKDKLKDITDIAVVGTFTNQAGTGGGVEVWITPDATNLGDPAAITAGATKLWGPGAIGATGSSVTIGWDESAKLFNPAGKAILLQEAKGDGQFTLYAIGTPGSVNTILVENGGLILTIAAGL
jgi:hypothetical protein